MIKLADIFEFRGIDKFYFAEVTQDDENGYACGPLTHIPVQEVGKSTDSAQEAHYYDNKAMIVVNSEGPDTISLVLAPPELEKLSKMIGKSFDPLTGMMVDSPRQDKYFAIMYRAKGTDGKYRYVSRLKGQFNIPEETYQTENDGTDTNNTSFEFTGIYTEHEFNKGIYDGTQWHKSGVKGIVVDTRYGLADVSNFFGSVQTPDTVEVAATTNVTGVGVAPSTANVTVGGTVQLDADVVPHNATNKVVAWTSDDTDKATVDATGKVSALAAGSVTITCTTDDGNFTDTCEITITEPTP